MPAEEECAHRLESLTTPCGVCKEASIGSAQKTELLYPSSGGPRDATPIRRHRVEGKVRCRHRGLQVRCRCGREPSEVLGGWSNTRAGSKPLRVLRSERWCHGYAAERGAQSKRSSNPTEVPSVTRNVSATAVRRVNRRVVSSRSVNRPGPRAAHTPATRAHRHHRIQHSRVTRFADARCTNKPARCGTHPNSVPLHPTQPHSHARQCNSSGSCSCH